MPVVPFHISANGNRKLVYGLLDSDSEETLISNKLADFLKLKGDPLDVVLITADERHNNLQTQDATFNNISVDDVTGHKISDALVVKNTQFKF